MDLDPTTVFSAIVVAGVIATALYYGLRAPHAFPKEIIIKPDVCVVEAPVVKVEAPVILTSEKASAVAQAAKRAKHKAGHKTSTRNRKRGKR